MDADEGPDQQTNDDCDEEDQGPQLPVETAWLFWHRDPLSSFPDLSGLGWGDQFAFVDDGLLVSPKRSTGHYEPASVSQRPDEVQPPALIAGVVLAKPEKPAAVPDDVIIPWRVVVFHRGLVQIKKELKLSSDLSNRNL